MEGLKTPTLVMPHSTWPPCTIQRPPTFRPRYAPAAVADVPVRFTVVVIIPAPLPINSPVLQSIIDHAHLVERQVSVHVTVY